MGSNGGNEIYSGTEEEGSKTNIEIKIKTLDSQVYPLRVNKQVPVPVLKEQIASVTGVMSEQQRLICRGRVLKDEELLSAYHVEDGHTLHLVTRQPVPPSSETLPGQPAYPALSTARGQRTQVAPGVVVETFNIPGQGDGVHPHINRLVSAVLLSFGINSTGNEELNVQARDAERHGRTLGGNSMTASIQQQPEQAGIRNRSDRSYDASGLPSAVAMGHLQPHVLSDSLTILSLYLSRMRQEYGANERGSNTQAAAMHGTEGTESDSTSLSGTVREGLPALAEVLLSTRDMLIEQTAECLLRLGRELHNQSNATDLMVQLNTQSNALRSGIRLQNLGAFLLELGRTTMTLCMGQTPSEAVVNAGPALFISRSGPNPLMVQPLPQMGTSFGAIPRVRVTSSGLFYDGEVGAFPRHAGTQIRRSGSSTGGANVIQEVQAGSQHLSQQRNSTTSTGIQPHVSQATSGVSEGPSAERGVRLVPTRPTTDAVPGPIHHFPIFRRFQHVASGELSSRSGSQVFSESPPSDFQTEREPVSGSAVQINGDDHARNGNSTNPAVEQGLFPNSISHPIDLNVIPNGGTDIFLESDREIPTEIQFRGNILPGSEIQLEESSFQTTASGSVTHNVEASSAATDAQEAELTVSNQGIFLSNLLGQIMPFISQFAGEEPNVLSAEAANASENGTTQQSSAEAENSNVGTSRRKNDVPQSPPNSKRQKVE